MRSTTAAPMADLDDGLNERQRRFVELYMGAHGGNATQAYKGAASLTSDELRARLSVPE